MNTQVQNYLASLLCGVNTRQNPTFTWSEAVPSNDGGDWSSRQTRAETDSKDLERALTLLMGEFAGLAVDSEIFRGELPVGVDNGFMVHISEIAPMQEPRKISFTAVFLGRHTDRAAQLSAAAKLAEKLPLPAILTVSSDVITSPVSFLDVAMVRHASFNQGYDDGRMKMFCNLSIEAQVIL